MYKFQPTLLDKSQWSNETTLYVDGNTSIHNIIFFTSYCHCFIHCNTMYMYEPDCIVHFFVWLSNQSVKCTLPPIEPPPHTPYRKGDNFKPEGWKKTKLMGYRDGLHSILCSSVTKLGKEKGQVLTLVWLQGSKSVKMLIYLPRYI